MVTAEALGAVWLPTPPLDGFLWHRRACASCGGPGWSLLEVKDPAREGRKHEFTPEQIILMARLNERQVPYRVIRTEADMLALLGAQRSA